jgi:hypothetical protein
VVSTRSSPSGSAQKEAISIKPVVKSKAADPYAWILELPSKEKHLLAKRAGLNGKLKSWFPPITAESRNVILQRLLAEAKFTKAAGKLSHAL